jgi:hypothetical protein
VAFVLTDEGEDFESGQAGGGDFFERCFNGGRRTRRRGALAHGLCGWIGRRFGQDGFLLRAKDTLGSIFAASTSLMNHLSGCVSGLIMLMMVLEIADAA